jgi:hypothetical protein
MTLYLQIYIGTGLVMSLGLYLFQYEHPSQFAKDIDKAIHGERSWHYRLREKLVIPGALLLITVCWPIAIYMAVKDLIVKKMNSDEKENEYPYIARPQYLLEECNIGQIEAENIYSDPFNGVSSLPFGHMNKAWVEFINQLSQEGKLHRFKTPKNTPFGEYGELLEEAVEGYAITRNGQIVCEFIHESY